MERGTTEGLDHPALTGAARPLGPLVRPTLL